MDEKTTPLPPVEVKSFSDISELKLQEQGKSQGANIVYVPTPVPPPKTVIEPIRYTAVAAAVALGILLAGFIYFGLRFACVKFDWWSLYNIISF